MMELAQNIAAQGDFTVEDNDKCNNSSLFRGSLQDFG